MARDTVLPVKLRNTIGQFAVHLFAVMLAGEYGYFGSFGGKMFVFINSKYGSELGIFIEVFRTILILFGILQWGYLEFSSIFGFLLSCLRKSTTNGYVTDVNMINMTSNVLN